MNDFVGKESENMRRFLANISVNKKLNSNVYLKIFFVLQTIDHDYDEPRSSNLNCSHDDKCDIDLGREYSILHSTLADLFEQIDLNTRRTLNELEYVLNELTNIKLFYSSTQNGTQIHLHHHHHHVYHHSTPTTTTITSTNSDHFSKESNDNRSSPYGSQISLSLAGTGTTNGSSQGYHSISASPTIITVENINKENIRAPLSFKNPLFNNQIIQTKEHIHTDSDSDDDNNQKNLNQTQTDSTKALYFVNNLCVESIKNSSSQQSLVHSPSRQSLQQQQQQQQQPLFVVNNGYMTRSTQSLASTSSSNMNTPITTKNSSTTYYYLRTNDEFNGTNKRQSISSSQQPPKMGVKALNHTSSNKVK